MNTSGEESTDWGELLADGIAHHQQGELTSAETKYSEVLKHDPDNADAHHLLGVIAHQMGNTSIGIERVKKSLSINPIQASALNNLGNMLVDADRLDEAIDTYQRAIDLNPEYLQAHHNLGNALSVSGKIVESAACYVRVLQFSPADDESRLSLGSCLEMLGQFIEAEREFRTVLENDPKSIRALKRLGTTLRKSGRLEEAKDVYQQWLDLSPENPIAQHLLAACSSENVPERASAEYVKSAFDIHSEEFESCLTELNYRVPELLGEMVKQQFGDQPRGNLMVADLGCGTGLCARWLRDYAKRLHGVDLSPRMLDKAAEKKLYDNLIEAELTAFLDNCGDEYDLLVAADTLVYVGAIESTLAAAHGALRDDGILLFSLEKLGEDVEGPGYRMEPSGRYTHRSDYVRRWLEQVGFKVQQFVEADLREDGGARVSGYLVLAQRG